MHIKYPPFYEAARIQMYIMIAIWIAGIGGLSLFHQRAAVHLAMLSWNSGFLTWSSPYHLELKTSKDFTIGLSRFFQNIKIYIVPFVLLLISVRLDMSARICQSTPPYPHDFEQLT